MTNRQSKELQASVRFIGYDHGEKVGFVILDDDNCVDMNGCINLFRRIDRGVKAIYTFAGEEPDTAYYLDGEWKPGDFTGTTHDFFRAVMAHASA